MPNETPIPQCQNPEAYRTVHRVDSQVVHWVKNSSNACLLLVVTEKWPWSEHYEVPGATRLADRSVPEGARSYCLRPLGRV